MKLSRFIVQFSICTLFLLLLAGCLDEIDSVITETVDQGVAIQGRIVKGNPSFVAVTIKSVFNFKNSPRFLDVKEVSVEDELGNSLRLESNADGRFFLEIPANHPFFGVEYGKSYRVNVTTLEDKKYRSTLEQLYPAPLPDSLTVKKVVVETVDNRGISRMFDQLVYSISTSLKPTNSNENARLAWKVSSTYQFTDSPGSYGRTSCSPTQIDDQSKSCYITIAPLTNQALLDGSNLSVDRIDSLEILTTSINSIHSEGLYMTAIQQSLSETAYEYLAQIRNLGERTGDPFQAPVGRIVTNLSNVDDPSENVFGFFYATEEVVERVFVSPDFVDNPGRPCPAPRLSLGQGPSNCCNCTTIPNASTVKPEWWVN